MDISNKFSFELNFKTVRDQAENLARGDLILRINDELIWFQQEEEGDPKLGGESRVPADWTWVDLLAYLAKNWSFLMYEELYPLDLHPETPLDLRKLAEARWHNAQLEEEQIFDEDDEVCAFDKRHNLASGLKGIYLPSVYVVREGKLAWVCVKDDHGNETVLKERFSFEVVKEVLMGVANKIADHLANSTHPRSVRAVQAWINAQESILKHVISIRSGLNDSDLKAIEQLAANEPDFWELEGRHDDSEILAAARLSPGSMGIADRKEILARIKSVSYRVTPVLDSLSEECLATMPVHDRAKPFVGGYAAALWLRAKLGIEDGEVFEPKQWLENWGVSLEYIEAHEELEALAFWGRKHGPAILINKHGSVNSKSSGQRATLAHEICHLLLDRKGSLPFADAIGGNTPEWVEKRARAFAAELLLPRKTISKLVTVYLMMASESLHSEAVELAIANASAHYDVSAGLIINQLYNSKSKDYSKEAWDKIQRLHIQYSRETRLA
ncbi:Zn-dependent peptidase ImmA (M78 family) [Pseudomonas sp. OG7]|uniref:ImmA/IrrE family metallo-endopeptidase n=1 Tax=Pseudomonas sp. OG7 TaxID=2587037 RepID=UPI00161D0596|nr:ImmA/IrrE family metallo-endopeptidase [Pseudomonas sp. OG7]MBB3272757.1 Zn-dependent peptidase ImmA (M78 family) [Pseudomonas sp. OG7]